MKTRRGYIFSWYNSGRNYGQTLQAYALQKVLRDMGYEVEHVCFGSNRELSETIISIIKDLRELSKTQRRIQKKFNTFIVNNMKTTERLKTDQDVHNFIKKDILFF